MLCPPCVHSAEFLVVPSNEGRWTESPRWARPEGPEPWLETRDHLHTRLLTKTNQLNYHQNGESSPSLSTFSNVLQDIPNRLCTHSLWEKETSCHMKHFVKDITRSSVLHLAAERRTDPLSNFPPPPPHHCSISANKL
ncbi:unnamed protein product [Arctogadus glacialis]